jgi:hypothetical protein
LENALKSTNLATVRAYIGNSAASSEDDYNRIKKAEASVESKIKKKQESTRGG